MPDERAEINRGVAEACGYTRKSYGYSDDPYYGRSEMFHWFDKQGEIAIPPDYCSSLDAGVEACRVLGLAPVIDFSNKDMSHARVYALNEDDFDDSEYSSGFVDPSEPHAEALALARAVWEAVK